MSRWLWVNQPLRVSACRPLLMTVQSSQTSGIKATKKEAVTSTVARLFLNFRRADVVAARVGGGGGGDGGGHATWLRATTARAAALTAKVNKNRNKPAAI